ncbi:MAG: type IIA DNA topoisomerase subunit B, partial [Treponema sp.]|nr:type IIA DNA topoisomerase subunit B [Treponema sp.]
MEKATPTKNSAAGTQSGGKTGTGRGLASRAGELKAAKEAAGAAKPAAKRSGAAAYAGAQAAAKTAAKAAVYDESKIKTLSSLEHIRLRTGMYIGRLGDGSNPDDGIYV